MMDGSNNDNPETITSVLQYNDSLQAQVPGFTMGRPGLQMV